MGKLTTFSLEQYIHVTEIEQAGWHRIDYSAEGYHHMMYVSLNVLHWLHLEKGHHYKITVEPATPLESDSGVGAPE